MTLQLASAVSISRRVSSSGGQEQLGRCLRELWDQAMEDRNLEVGEALLPSTRRFLIYTNSS